MQNGIRHIFYITLCMAIISMSYFLLLAANMPMWVIVPEMVVALMLFTSWFSKKCSINHDTDKTSILTLIILAIGIVIAGKNIYNCATAHGGWDAWAIWNYHAKFLADSEHWNFLFKSFVDDHPDYPLMLPALTGFFTRLCSGSYFVLNPLIFSIFITVATISLIYMRLAQRNVIIAILILLLLATNQYFIMQGVAQYADLPLGFMMLCSIICFELSSENKHYIILSTAFLGCCIWTKNEGMVLAPIFLLFHVRTLLKKENLRFAILGMAFPCMVWLLFKLCYAPPNDMATRVSGKLLQQAFMPDRYQLIYQYFKTNLNSNFYIEKIMFFIYIGLCAVRRRLPSLNMRMILCMMVCYASFYVFTFQNLEWHLSTSMDRLMLQLTPAFIYIIASEFADYAVINDFLSKIVSGLQRPR